MTTEVERLLVRLEVSQRRFERQLASASRSADRRATGIERRFNRMNRNIIRGFQRIGASAQRSFGTVSRFALAAAGALGTRELVRYSDAWTRVGNQIAAASQISGVQARSLQELNDLASNNRAGLEETAQLYARLLRVSGDLGASEEQVAQATETVARAFRAGGAAATEQAAGVLQLGQALGSGFLQGDELRSIRENAPLIAQAIADEFDTTIGALRDLGAEGELTSDRVFAAILNGQEQINAAFSETVPTISDGLTVLKNGLLEFLAAFNEGSGADSALATGLADIGAFLEENSERARRFGAQVSEAFAIIGEVTDRVSGTFTGVGDALDATADDVRGFMDDVLNVFQATISAVGAVPETIAAATLNVVDANASAAVGIVNAAVSQVERMVNEMIAALNTLIEAIQSVSSIAGSLLPGGRVLSQAIDQIGTLDPVSLPRLEPPTQLEDRNTADVFRDARDGIREQLEAIEDTFEGWNRRIERAGQTPYDPNDPRGNQLGDGNGSGYRPPAPNSDRPVFDPSAVGGTGGGSGRGGGGGSRRTPGLFEDIARQRRDLELQIQLIGRTQAETAALRAEEELLSEARRRGLDLNERSITTGRTLAEEIAIQAEALGDLTQEYERANEAQQEITAGIESFADAVAGAIVEGRSFGESMRRVFAQVASDFISSGISNLLTGGLSLFGSGRGGGGGLARFFAGFFGTGGRIPAGQFGIAGENGAEIVTGPATVMSTAETAQVLNGRAGASGPSEIILRLDLPDHVTFEEARQISGDTAIRIVTENNQVLAQQRRRQA